MGMAIREKTTSFLSRFQGRVHAQQRLTFVVHIKQKNEHFSYLLVSYDLSIRSGRFKIK
jgi:hypothetical protein